MKFFFVWFLKVSIHLQSSINYNNRTMIDLNWKTNKRNDKLGSKRVATESREKTQLQHTSEAWKLKTDLDQSYQEEKVDTPSYQSEDIEAKHQGWSAILSDNHTTSIMQDHEKEKERNNHFFQMLKQKMPFYKYRSKDRKKLSLKHFENHPLSSSVRSVDFKRESPSLEKVKALHCQRKQILNETNNIIRDDQMSHLAELSRKKCLNCNCGKQTFQKPSRIELMKQMIFTLRNKDEDIEKVIVSHSPKRKKCLQEGLKQNVRKGGMMTKIIRMKNQMIDSQPVNVQGTPAHFRLFKQQSTFTPQSSSRHKRMCQTQPYQFNHRYQSIDNQEATPIEKVTAFVREDQNDLRSNDILKADNFTFGELNKNQMRNQLQLMQRHMKKVSIELEEKESSQTENRRLFI